MRQQNPTLPAIIDIMSLDTIAYIEEVNQVATEYIKGNDASAIAKMFGMPRQRVVSHLSAWQRMVTDNEAIRSRAKEALAGADVHFNYLIKQTYEVIDEATVNGDLRSKTGGIKLVLDIEKSRIELLQKAGLLENKELADQLIESERKQEVIVGILRDVVGSCPTCRAEVARRLATITGPDEASVVVHT